MVSQRVDHREVHFLEGEMEVERKVAAFERSLDELLLLFRERAAGSARSEPAWDTPSG